MLFNDYNRVQKEQKQRGRAETQGGTMKQFNFRLLNNYKNRGQDIEQSIRYTLTNTICKADNVAYDKGTDCLNYQIKSARATVCKGLDLKAYLDRDQATAYIYGTLNGKAYEMNREEYENFVSEFGTVDRESSKNGGKTKIRLKHETTAMLKWLEDRA